MPDVIATDLAPLPDLLRLFTKSPAEWRGQVRGGNASIAVPSHHRGLDGRRPLCFCRGVCARHSATPCSGMWFRRD